MVAIGASLKRYNLEDHISSLRPIWQGKYVIDSSINL
jgi:hypothetical protein